MHGNTVEIYPITNVYSTLTKYFFLIRESNYSIHILIKTASKPFVNNETQRLFPYMWTKLRVVWVSRNLCNGVYTSTLEFFEKIGQQWSRIHKTPGIYKLYVLTNTIIVYTPIVYTLTKCCQTPCSVIF